MKTIERVLGITHSNKLITVEYALGIIVCFTLCFIQLYKVAAVSQEIAQKCKIIILLFLDDYNLYYLTDSWFGWKRDFTDHQWRNFRSSLPLIYCFAFIFLTISYFVKIFSKKNLKVYYLIIGSGYAIYLHGVKIIFLLFIILCEFSLTKIYNLIGPKVFTMLT